MTTIHIPADREALVASLAGIEGLLTAKRWERAAIVYAWTKTKSGPGRPRKSPESGDIRLTPAAFGALGVAGLGEQQVREYREAWVKAADEVAKTNAHWADEMRDLGPSEAIDLPDLPWKDHFGESTRDVQVRTAKAEIIRNPGIVAEAMRVSEHVAETVAKDIAHDEELSETVGRASFAKRIGVERIPRVAPAIVETRDYDRELHLALLEVGKLLRDERDGLFTVSGIVESQLRLLAIILDRRASKADKDDVMVAITDFLRESKESA